MSPSISSTSIPPQLQRHLQRPLPRARFLRVRRPDTGIRRHLALEQRCRVGVSADRNQRPQEAGRPSTGHAPIPRPERHDGLSHQILLPANALTSANEQPSIQSRLVHSLGDRRHMRGHSRNHIRASGHISTWRAIARLRALCSGRRYNRGNRSRRLRGRQTIPNIQDLSTSLDHCPQNYT